MTERERFIRTLRFESVDRPPLSMPAPWLATRRRWEREGCPAGVDLYDYFEVPPLLTHHVAIETVLSPPFEEIVLEEGSDYVIKIDHHGVKVKNFPDETSMPEFLEYPIKGRESLPWLREKLSWHNSARIAQGWIEGAQTAQENGAAVLCNGGMYFGFLNEHMGTEELLLTYYDDPDFIHEINEMLCTLCEEALKTTLASVTLDFVGYHEDMAYKNGSLISPALFREFMTPYYRRIQAVTAQTGVDIHLMDSDGDISELIPLWLECGVNCMTPMEVAAGLDVVALRREYGRELRMTGGFDKRIFAAGKEQIRAELERLRPVWEEGGYIPGIDHNVPYDVSWENMCYYVRTLKSMLGIG